MTVDAASGVVHEALLAHASVHSYHPVRAYLDALRWDRVPRLDTGG